MPFKPGQRWISDTESELGLGTVVAVDARMVTLLFPASGENRRYARSDAPVTRVIFHPGDTVTSHEGWQLTVTDVQDDAGLLTYHGTRTDNGEPAALREVMLDSQLTFSKPQDRLFAGQIDRADRFALRYRARCRQCEQFQLPESGLRGMRTSLIPHQLHIAHDVAHRTAPRVLLADEVGLGKTIEAGMIIHHQLLAGRISRVLILVPETLQHQWLVEMLRRFNLHFALFDADRFNEALHDSANPFETEQLVLCSLSFVRSNKQRLEALSTADWDLLVVDEAHHLVWDEHQPSAEYRVVETLAAQIPAVLLLTATPEQLGMQSHFARLRLLDPDRFHSYDAFLQEQAHYRPVADAVAQMLSGQPLNAEQRDKLAALLPEAETAALLAVVNDNDDAAEHARHQLIAQLMDRHGTSRVLFRNTRQNVQGFPARRLLQIGLTMPEQYLTAIKVARMMSAREPLERQAATLLYPEQIYQDFEGEQATWWNFDPRVSWLIDWLRSHRDQKVLVICAKAQTALQLEQALREREGLRAAVFHEGMTLIERDRAAAWFAAVEDGAQVLICSEIGSEGRNFQFASQLVMFDLPLNPDLLEQRIGRLDRIGQAHEICILVPYLEQSAQAVLLRWYHEGLNAFEQTCPAGHALFTQHREALLRCLAAPENHAELDTLIEQCRLQGEALKAQLEEGRDRLLELHSGGGEAAERLAERIAAQDNDPGLVNFALNLFDIIGINQEDRGEHMMVITPSDHMLVPDFPGLSEEGFTVTFARDKALVREDVQFLSWEHPLIRNGIDLLLSGDIGSNAVSLLKNRALPPGTLLLELIYVVEAQAPKTLQLTRFLPPTPLRLLLDGQGRNLAPQVDFEQMHRQLSPVNRHTASRLVSAARDEIFTLLQRGETQAAPLAQALIDTAAQKAQQQLDGELARLKALQRVNPNIREEEVAALHEERDEVLTRLRAASWRLDALRLIIVAHQ